VLPLAAGGLTVAVLRGNRDLPGLTVATLTFAVWLEAALLARLAETLILTSHHAHPRRPARRRPVSRTRRRR